MAGCSIRRCRSAPTPRSRARIPTRSSPICDRSRRCTQPNRPHDLRFPYNNRSLILGWRTLFFREGEYQPDPTQIRRMESRRLSRGGPGPLLDVPHADQRAWRQLGIAGLRGRADPDAELVRAVADLEQGGGLGDWSIKDISDLLRTGVSQRGAVYGPMAEVVYNSLQYLTDDDIRAMAVYLKSLAQGSRRRAPASSRAGAPRAACCMSFGQTVYDSQCARCHGAEGRGKPPHYPPLAEQSSRSRWTRPSTRSAWC